MPGGQITSSHRRGRGSFAQSGPSWRRGTRADGLTPAPAPTSSGLRAAIGVVAILGVACLTAACHAGNCVHAFG
eukprot:363768-Chlamydomonas_euryale.AAC.4